jgi:phosphatidylglycerophosphatase C
MKKIKVAIYDFDGTLYKGDCTIDFYKFCLKKYPYKIFKLPYHLFLAVLWKIKIISTNKFKENFLSITNWKNKVKDVEEFWKIYHKNIFFNIKKELKKDKNNNLKIIIISASPMFLLSGIYKKIGADVLIATNFVENKILGNNCKGNEKACLLKKFENNNNIKFNIVKMVSDSKDDLPLYKLAKDCYKVNKKGKLLKGILK